MFAHARAILAALLGFLGSPSSGGTSAPGATFIVLNNAAPVTTRWNGLGANYMGFAEMSESTRDGMTAATRSIEYQRVADSGVKTVSTWVGNDWLCTSYPTGCNTFNSAHWVAFETWLAKMQALGVSVVVKGLWQFPSDICGPTNTPCIPGASDLTAYTQLVSDMLNRLVNVKGYTNVVGLAAFTEPNFPNDTFPGGVAATAYYATVVTALRAKLAADDAGRTPILGRVAIIGPDEESQSTDTWIQYMQANAPAAFDAWSSHIYCATPQFGPLSLTVSSCPAYSALIAQLSGWVADAGSKGLTFSELNMLGSTNFNVYRNTSDNGLLISRFIDGEVRAGGRAVLLWMMQDQHWPDFSTVGYQQEYGLLGRWLGQTTDVPPSWYAMSLIANLTGGGGNTTVNGVYGGTSTLHATEYSIPNGAPHCTDPLGCRTLEVINEGATAQAITWGYNAAIGARTFYRYVYNAEDPPRPRPSKPAYLVPWDSQFTGVSGLAPSSLIPGHSVVFFSTINLGEQAPASLFLGCTAVASATASGTAANLVDGNTTHVAGAANSWVPSGAGATITITCGAPVTINRLELSMVGGEWPKWWPDYATGSFPAEPSQYQFKAFNGTSYVDVAPAINVTSNTQWQRTHTFASVTASQFQLTIPNTPTSGVTEVGGFFDVAPPDNWLGYYVANDGARTAGTQVEYTIATTTQAIQAGDTFEYDLTLLDRTDYLVTQPKAGVGGVDVVIDAGCSSTELRAVAGFVDQNGTSGSTASDLTAWGFPGPWHRVMTLPSCATGHNIVSVAITQERADGTCLTVDTPCTGGYTSSTATAFYHRACLMRGGSSVWCAYNGGGPQTFVAAHFSSIFSADGFVSKP